MGQKVTFAVSTPCNRRGKPSGHRLLTFDEDRLSVIPQEVTNVTADTEVNVQAFCYLKPDKRIVVPQDINTGILDSSDYMLLAKSNGFIEIIQDYKYKVENNLSLEANFLLKCTPEDYTDYGSDCTIAGLEYREGLLYCCICSGRIYVYILNLPHDYTQTQNLSIVSPKADIFHSSHFDGAASQSSREAQSIEEATFFLNMKFTGRSRLKHVCYYLLPIEPDHLRLSPSIFLFSKVYQGKLIYKPSIYVQLDQGVSGFRTNPLDRLSFLTILPRSPLMIRKIMLPTVYVDFFVTFISIKKRIQQTRAEEITSWNRLAKELGHDSLVNWIISEPLHEVDSFGSVVWEDLVRCDGISVLRTIIVWIQRQGHTKDDIYELFHRSDLIGSNSSSRSSSSEPRPLGGRRRPSRFGLRRSGAIRESVDLPCSATWGLDLFIRDVRKNTFMVDFGVVQSNFDSNCNDNSSQPEEEESTRTSFLTDNYKNLDIICIDQYLSLSVFRPKYLDEALIKIDSFRNVFEVGSTRDTNIEDDNMRSTLSKLNSFKKLFMITDWLCMVLDTNGVILLDRRKLGDTKNLLNNEPSAIRIVGFNIGLISDAILITNSLSSCHDCGGIEITYKLIVTCIPNEILAFKGKFLAHSKIGEITLCDSLKLNRKHRFVDRICLLEYDTRTDSKKRPYLGEERNPNNIKRPRRD